MSAEKQKGRNRGSYSIRNRILAGVLLYLVPLTVLLLTYNFYTINLLRERTATANHNSLLVYSEIVETQLYAISLNLLDATINNPGFFTARNSDNRLHIYQSAHGIVENLQYKIVQSPYIECYFTMIKGFNRQIYSNEAINRYSIDEKITLNRALLDLVDERPRFYGLNWRWIEIGGYTYLMQVIGSDGVYIGALIDLEKLVYPLARSQLFENYQMVYTSLDGTPLTNLAFIAENDINLDSNAASFYLTGNKNRFLVTGTPVERTNVHMVALIPDPTYLTGLNQIQIMLFFLSLAAVLAIPLVIFFLRKAFVKPLGRLVHTMNQIQNGSLDARMNVRFAASEFGQVNDTFNGMISQIQDLKIDAYEKELARQRAELQYLHFQIKPHFFLNSLKILFGLAERGKTGVIQEIILALSNHFRYMFKDNFTRVSLREELNYVKNYIRIQQL